MSASESTSPVSPQSHFDQQQIRLLRALRNGSLLPQLLRTYREQAAKQIADIQTAASAADNETVRLAAHTLKSASYSVGAARVGELCGQIETHARENRSEGILALCAELSERYHSLLPELNSYVTP